MREAVENGFPCEGRVTTGVNETSLRFARAQPLQGETRDFA
jgi:hypothetical protein